MPSAPAAIVLCRSRKTAGQTKGVPAPCGPERDTAEAVRRRTRGAAIDSGVFCATPKAQVAANKPAHLDRGRQMLKNTLS